MFLMFFVPYMRSQDEGYRFMTMQWSHFGSASEIGGVSVNVASMAMLEEDLTARLHQGQGFCLATLNLDHVTKLRQAGAFLQAYAAHSHITADGRPIVWISRLAGDEVSLLPGSDLVVPVAEIAARCGAPVAFLGTSDAALSGAAEALEAEIPGLQVVSRIAPPMGFDPTGPLADDYIAALGASGARVCLVALGAPKQEIFAHYASQKLPDMGFMSIGASLDFLSGHQRRAPRLMRQLALEWLWRLMQNPRRLAGRYAACFAVLPGLTLRALKLRLRMPNAL